MSGPMRMYAMRPIVRHDVPVQLPACMYALANIHGARNDGGGGVGDAAKTQNGTSVHGGSTPSADSSSGQLVAEQKNCTMTMAAVQQRQEVILKQLEDLKKQMTAIRTTLKSGSSQTCSRTTGISTTKTANTNQKVDAKHLPSEISLNINPSNPPYSLLLLQKLWKTTVNINLQSYVHSTVPSLPEPARKFVESIPEPVSVSNLPSVTVRLIWKAIGVNHMELTGARPIQGEVNLLRYLARLTASLNYVDDGEMDSFLDLCYSITRSKNKSERLPMLQRLSKKMAKGEFIFGHFSIVDIAAYSAVKQMTGAGEVNVGLTRWMNSCECY